MRERLRSNRGMLATALRTQTQSDRFDFLTQQRGMFSLLGFDDPMLDRLRETHGVYMVKQGRTNLAGLTQASIPIVAKAVAAELR